MKKWTVESIFICLILVFILSCKKSPTPISIDLGENAILAACNPGFGGPGTLVTVAIIISQNRQELRVFGLELFFDSKIFAFQKVSAGNLTGSWASVDGVEVSPGNLRIGGFVGAGSSIAKNSQGALALVQLKVTGVGASNTPQSQICLDRYIDELLNFQPAPACVSFTLKK